MTRTRNAVLLGVATTLIFSVASGSQDRAKVVPEMKVLLANDRVRVQFHDVAVPKAGHKFLPPGLKNVLRPWLHRR